MQARHVEFVNLHNANRDSTRPKSKKELIAELNAWEKVQAKGFPGGIKPTKRPDWSDEGWARQHRDEFANLIKRAQAKRVKVEEDKGNDTGNPSEDNGEGSNNTRAGSDANQDSMLQYDSMRSVPPAEMLTSSMTNPETENRPSSLSPPPGTWPQTPTRAFSPSPIQHSQPTSIQDIDPYEIPPSSQNRKYPIQSTAASDHTSLYDALPHISPKKPRGRNHGGRFFSSSSGLEASSSQGGGAGVGVGRPKRSWDEMEMGDESPNGSGSGQPIWLG